MNKEFYDGAKRMDTFSKTTLDAMHSLAYVLAGVPGMYVTGGAEEIVVHVNEDSAEDDRSNLKKVAWMGRGRWKVRIVGMI